VSSIEIKDVSITYDGKKNIVHHVTTTITPHKITTILGPNGCGKSTLLAAIARLRKPVTGQILIEEKDILEFHPKAFAKKLAVVFQQNEIPEDLTVEKLVRFGRLPYHNFLSKQTKEDDEAVEWALKETNLQHRKEESLTALSGGERQRVWIAMSLAQQTEMICLDEPTTYLDMYYQFELLQLIERLNHEHGITIVMVLHDLNQALQFSDEIIMMKNGEIVKKGVPEEVITPTSVKEVYQVDAIFKKDEELGHYIVPFPPKSFL